MNPICYPKVKVPVDLNEIITKFKCPNCGHSFEVSVDGLLQVGDPFCAHCEHEFSASDCTAFKRVTPYEVVHELRDLMQKHTKHYQEDFLRDKAILDNYNGKFFWGCRPNGTDLVLLDGNGNSDTILWVTGEDYNRSTTIMYYDGVHLAEISAQEAKGIWDMYQKEQK